MLESLLNKTDKETPTQVFSCEYCKIFPNSFLYTKPPGGCFCQFDKSNYSVLGISRPSLINQKYNLGWFLLKRFEDLSRVCSLHTISRNRCNTFLLINMQKTKTCSNKTLQQWLFVLISEFWQFEQVFVRYLMSILMTCK